MIKKNLEKFGKPLYVISPGDYLAIKEDCVMQTVTGNSLVVCLYDREKKLGGMAHFIVPGTIEKDRIYADKVARDGIQSMELLMAEIIKLGGDRKSLKAKIFGAGFVDSEIREMDKIEESNIEFVQEYFNLERIPVETEDLGGDKRRMIYFLPLDGTVYRRYQRRTNDSSETADLEKEYIDDAIKNKNKSGEVILF